MRITSITDKHTSFNPPPAELLIHDSLESQELLAHIDGCKRWLRQPYSEAVPSTGGRFSSSSLRGRRPR